MPKLSQALLVCKLAVLTTVRELHQTDMENDQLLCDETYEDDEKTDLTIDPRRTLVQRLQEHLAQTLAALSEAVADQGNRGRRFAYAVLVLLSSISILVPTVLVIVLRHGFSSPPTVSSDILSLEVISSGANHQFFSNTSLCPEPLSKQLCLLDADTRAWNVSNELDDQDQGVWGRTNHYMYGQWLETNNRSQTPRLT